MSLYIAAKAFPVADDFAAAKLAVFIASALAAIIGTAMLAAAQVHQDNARADQQRAERERGADRL